LRVLFVTPECYPLIKTGGLADVAGALSLALGGLGCQVRVLLPAYPQVLEVLGKTKTLAQLPRLFGASGRLLLGRTADGLEVLALDAPRHFERPGNPYLGHGTSSGPATPIWAPTARTGPTMPSASPRCPGPAANSASAAWGLGRRTWSTSTTGRPA
jgi:hypothetical protein